MNVHFGVMVTGGSALPCRADLAKFAELVRLIDDSGIEMIGTYDTSFLGADAYVRATPRSWGIQSRQWNVRPGSAPRKGHAEGVRHIRRRVGEKLNVSPSKLRRHFPGGRGR